MSSQGQRIPPDLLRGFDLTDGQSFLNYFDGFDVRTAQGRIDWQKKMVETVAGRIRKAKAAQPPNKLLGVKLNWKNLRLLCFVRCIKKSCKCNSTK